MQIKGFILKNREITSLVFIAAVIVVSLNQLMYYVFNSFIIIMTIIGFVFSFVINKGEFKVRFLWVSLFFALLFLSLKIQFAYYYAFLFLIYGLIESGFGRLGYPVILSGIVASPFFHYLDGLFGFEIRLQISKWVASTFRIAGKDATAIGNTIQFEESIFHVDPACLGLNMTLTSLLVSCIIIAYFERKQRCFYSLPKVTLFLILSFILVIIANYFRIISLILFNSVPNTVSHELIGILTMIIYTLLPFYFIMKLTNRKENKGAENIRNNHMKTIKSLNYHKAIMTGIILIILSIPNFSENLFRNPEFDEEASEIVVNGYITTVLENNVVRLSNNDVLIYIKPATEFYRGDHNPMVCWRGEGYSLRKETKVKEGDFLINKADLINDDFELKTAWWFQSEEDICTSSFQWRINSIRSKNKYRLINVTAGSQESVNKAIQQLFNTDLFEN
jgi:exosortase N